MIYFIALIVASMRSTGRSNSPARESQSGSQAEGSPVLPAAPHSPVTGPPLPRELLRLRPVRSTEITEIQRPQTPQTPHNSPGSQRELASTADRFTMASAALRSYFKEEKTTFIEKLPDHLKFIGSEIYKYYKDSKPFNELTVIEQTKFARETLEYARVNEFARLKITLKDLDPKREAFMTTLPISILKLLPDNSFTTHLPAELAKQIDKLRYTSFASTSTQRLEGLARNLIKFKNEKNSDLIPPLDLLKTTLQYELSLFNSKEIKELHNSMSTSLRIYREWLPAFGRKFVADGLIFVFFLLLVGLISSQIPLLNSDGGNKTTINIYNNTTQ